MTVALGALCTTVTGIPLLIWLFSKGNLGEHPASFIQLEQRIVLGTAVPAFLGAVVSILARLQDFENARGNDLKLLFLTAFFKPYIGMITGLFIVSALAIGVGGVQDIHLFPSKGETPEIWLNHRVFYLLYAVGFLAGFSERLATDFVQLAEERFSGRPRDTSRAGG
jgi:hypothetical protein